MFNQLMRKNFKNQSGMVMPMVMMIMVLALCIVAPGLVAAGTTAKVNRELESSTMAYYAAKAGMEDALWKFKVIPVGEIPGLTNLTVNGMTVERSLNTSALGENYHVVTSIAKLNGVEKAKIFAEVKVTYIPYTPFTPASTAVTGYPFRYAIASTGGSVTISNNVYVHSPNHIADVFAKGGILDASSAFIESVLGTGYYLQGKEIGSDDAFTGGCLPGDSNATFQQIDESWYLLRAQRPDQDHPDMLGGHWPASPEPASWPDITPSQLGPLGQTTYTASNVTLGGVGNNTYINGNLSISGNVQLRGVVWVNGNIIIDGDIGTSENSMEQSYLLAHGTASEPHSITINQGTRIDAHDNLNLIADNGNVTIMNNVWGHEGKGDFVTLGIIYAYNGQVYIHNNAGTTAGAILGKSVFLDNNVKVEYNENFRNNPPLGFKLNVAAREERPETPATTIVTVVNFSGQ
jgi:hypothetical protein